MMPGTVKVQFGCPLSIRDIWEYVEKENKTKQRKRNKLGLIIANLVFGSLGFDFVQDEVTKVRKFHLRSDKGKWRTFAKKVSHLDVLGAQ